MPPGVPLATYRLQLTAALDLDRAGELAPYLAALGVTHLYASPVLQARAGSEHGYDVTDPSRISVELGGQEAFDRLADALAAAGLGLVLDIVPNHMAVSPENPWWSDVLEHGQASPYASFFDIAWDPPWSPVGARVLVASLGRPYGEALEAGELRLVAADGALAIDYYEMRLPLDPCTWVDVLGEGREALEAAVGAGSAELAAFDAALAACRDLPDRGDAAGRREAARTVRGEMARLAASSPAIAAHVSARAAAFNGTPGQPRSFDRLDRLLRAQPWRLAYWRTAREKLNFRRFFNINDLIGIRPEREEVFEASHAKLLELVREGRVHGLRIDHVDGLAEPGAYLRRLRERLGPDHAHMWVVVEKILQRAEELPADWPVAGTTGYEFGALATRVLVDPTGLARLVAVYGRLVGTRADFDDVAYEKKRMIAAWLFPGEMRRLEHALASLAERDRHGADVPLAELRRALVEVTACLPVYRTYIAGPPVGERDEAWIAAAVAEARRRAPRLPARALDFVARLLRLEVVPSELAAAVSFVRTWQQVTGPLTAKGVEDTALYTYNALLALNDVGGDPAAGAASPADVHAFNLARAASWPHSMLATSTHDSKRSEDARARLAVLSEMAGDWERSLERWMAWNRPRKPVVGGELVPDVNTELAIYQTLLGAWPLDPAERGDLPDRIAAWAEKACREAREHTSWLRPNQPWEAGVRTFLAELWRAGGDFLPDLEAFAERLAPAGAVNALAQQLLKLTSPGVPDLYRGTELWDLSLVDPDNRRPVDFARRQAALEALRGRWVSAELPALADELASSWRDGRIKLHVTARSLAVRREQPDLFTRGRYLPLAPGGPGAAHCLAFARELRGAWALTVTPRLVAAAVHGPGLRLAAGPFADTVLPLPDGAPARWRDELSGAAVEAPVALGPLLARFPVALLRPLR